MTFFLSKSPCNIVYNNIIPGNFCIKPILEGCGGGSNGCGDCEDCWLPTLINIKEMELSNLEVCNTIDEKYKYIMTIKELEKLKVRSMSLLR